MDANDYAALPNIKRAKLAQTDPKLFNELRRAHLKRIEDTRELCNKAKTRAEYAEHHELLQALIGGSEAFLAYQTKRAAERPDPNLLENMTWAARADLANQNPAEYRRRREDFERRKEDLGRRAMAEQNPEHRKKLFEELSKMAGLNL